MTMKLCFKCRVSQPVENFYRHPMMADGLLGKCRECTKSDVRMNRAANVVKVRNYDRARNSLPHRLLARARRTVLERASDPRLARVRGQTRRLIERGVINKPAACERCGDSSRRLEAHHHDYSIAHVVSFLCKPCHALADRERKESERSTSF